MYVPIRLQPCGGSPLAAAARTALRSHRRNPTACDGVCMILRRACARLSTSTASQCLSSGCCAGGCTRSKRRTRQGRARTAAIIGRARSPTSVCSRSNSECARRFRPPAACAQVRDHSQYESRVEAPCSKLGSRRVMSSFRIMAPGATVGRQRRLGCVYAGAAWSRNASP